MNRRTLLAHCAAGLAGASIFDGSTYAMAPDQAAGSSSSRTADRETLRVMSFNIRYGTANDGDNRWDVRKDFLIDVLRAEKPDILGVQEALFPQLSYVQQALPEYGVVGVGRDDGVRAGEYTAILYRSALLSLGRSDTFWLSDTPEVVASKSWGNNITRICTWAQLATPAGRPLLVYNVHLDHQSQPSREKSALLLRARIAARTPAAPAIVMGDFNAGERNAAVSSMITGGILVDTFRAKHPSASPVGTFTGFKHGQVNGEKIDHIFATTDWSIVDAAIIRTERNQRYPSDHFPVTATLALTQ